MGIVKLNVMLDKLYRILRDVNADNFPCTALYRVKSERACMCECIKDTLSVAVFLYLLPVEFLVKEIACLLSPCNVNLELDFIFCYFNDIISTTVNPSRPLFKPLFFTYGGITTLINAVWFYNVFKGIDYFITENLASKGKELHYKIYGTGCNIFFHNKTRNKIGLTVNKAAAVIGRKIQCTYVHGMGYNLFPIRGPVLHDFVGMLASDEPYRYAGLFVYYRGT